MIEVKKVDEVDSVHVLSPVPYVDDQVKNDAREEFATLMALSAQEVPDSLIDMWWEVKHMVSRLQPGDIDIQHMAIMVMLDKSNREKAVGQTVRKASGNPNAKTY